MNNQITTDQEILLILNRLNPIQEINESILFLKKEIEKKETFDYHIHLYENISLKYNECLKTKFPLYSWIGNGKSYITEKDRNLKFFNYTGISFQVRDIILDLIKNENYKWRIYDDKMYCILARKIYEKMIHMNYSSE